MPVGGTEGYGLELETKLGELRKAIRNSLFGIVKANYSEWSSQTIRNSGGKLFGIVEPNYSEYSGETIRNLVFGISLSHYSE